MPEYPTAPPGTGFARFLDSLEELDTEYAGHTREGGSFHCPIHEDEKASFDVTVGNNGLPVWNCKPCLTRLGDSKALASELRAAGVKWQGEPVRPDDVDWGSVPAPSFGRGAAGGSVGRLVAVYDYRHANGDRNFKVGRYEHKGDKTFRVYRWVRELGDYAPGYGEAQRTPYHFEQFTDWSAGPGVVWLVEGEKAADALIERGHHATTFPGGADGKLEPGWTDWFREFADVRVWPDADGAGVARAKRLGRALKEAGVPVSMWGVNDGKVSAKDDAFDALGRRVGKNDVRKLGGRDLEALAALKPLTPKAPAAAGGKPGEPAGGSGGKGTGLVVAGKQIVSAGGGSAILGTDDGDLIGDLADEVRDGPPPYGTTVNVDPYRFAEEMLDREFRDEAGTLMLRFRHDDRTFWLWSAPRARYTHLSEDEVKARVARLLADAEETTNDGTVRPVSIKARTYGELVEVLRVLTLTSEHGAGALLPSVGGVPFRNGWLDVESGALVPIGPERDVRWNVPADYDDKAKCPEWFAFLDSIGWTAGTEERRLLRQWFGYVLSGSTDQQKALLLLGPKRAGKGTVLGVAEALLGDGAVGTQLDSFASNFGMQNLIGKGLATIGDARFGFRTDKKVVERILSLTSGDTMTIDVKHKNPLSVRLGARLMVATNESPKFIEASDALATRFVVLEFTRTFYGREDLGLRRRIMAELPGIARWALGGYKEILGLGSFSETAAGLRLQDQMIRDAAPVRVFVEEECEFGDFYVESQALFDEYLLWAERNNIYKMDRPSFFRDLNTAFPGQVSDYYKRVSGKQVRCKKGMRVK